MRLIKGLVNILFWMLVLGFAACYLTPLAAQPLEEHACAPVRAYLSGVVSAFNIPIFEILLIVIPLLLIAMLASGRISCVTTVAKLLLAAYIVTLGVPSKLPSRAAEPVEFTSEEYVRAAELVTDALADLTPPKEDISALASRRAAEYARDKLSVRLPDPRIKTTLAPSVLTEMGMIAYYSFVSTEIVLNTAAPDFMRAFSAAHETMHFFGIASEDEANLFALAALLESGEGELEFCAYLCAFIYIGADICAENRDTYEEIYAKLPASAREQLALRHAFLEGKGETLGTISSALNDAAISLRDSRGAESYSYTSRLVVAYLLE